MTHTDRLPTARQLRRATMPRLHRAPRGAAAIAAPCGLRAQESAHARMTLGGPPPTVRTEADLKAFLDDLESQEFAINTGARHRDVLPVARRDHASGGRHQRPGERPPEPPRLRGDRQRVAGQGLRQHARAARRAPRSGVPAGQGQPAPRTVALPICSPRSRTRSRSFATRSAAQRYTSTALGEIVDTAGDRELRHGAFMAESQRTPVIGPSVLRAMALNDSIGRQEGFANGADAGLVLSSLNRAQVLHDLDAFERATRPAYLAMLGRIRNDLHITPRRTVGHRLLADATGARGRRCVRSGPGTHATPRSVQGTRLPFGQPADRCACLGRAHRRHHVPDPPPVRGAPPHESVHGSDFYETLFHEYGHALNAVLMRPDLSPIFLGGDETPMSEGTAETLGHFAYDRHWLARAANLTPGKAAALETVGKEQLPALAPPLDLPQRLDRAQCVFEPPRRPRGR